MPVVALDDGDDLAPLRGIAGTLDGDVDRLSTARREDRVFHAGGDIDERLGQCGACNRRKPVIADVEIVERAFQRLDQFRMPVAEVVGAAIQVQVDQPAP